MGFRKVADTIELFMFDIGNARAFPKEHWTRIRTSNMVELVNADIKWLINVLGQFQSWIADETDRAGSHQQKLRIGYRHQILGYGWAAR